MSKLRAGNVITKLLLAGLVSFFVIQFIPVNRSNPAVESEIPAPPQVRAFLRRACYDCHSNETVWPWYSKVAPISWLVALDVHEGREEVNFSTWNRYNHDQQTKMLKESWEEISEGEMPPSSFLFMHKEAALSQAERELLRKWVSDLTTE